MRRPIPHRAPAFPTHEPPLPLHPPDLSAVPLPVTPGPRAIEDDAFPFEALSDIAEVESWRKEINRPLSYIHKWWARRLGTVFRAITIGAFAPKGADLLELFYRPIRLPGTVVFDPFMGSGTTICEATKLGARAIGRDINSVAHFLVKNAFAAHDRPAILHEFRIIEHDVADRIRRFYRASLPDGTAADVLYYFWVKTVPCPACHKAVDLFSTYVFARHALPRRHPAAKALCPSCGAITDARYDACAVRCVGCSRVFDPRAAPALRQNATCPNCTATFPIAKTIRAHARAPSHRLYAKLVLLPDGRKSYFGITDDDRHLYAKATLALSDRTNAFPVVPIHPGYNTDQVLGYNYRHWHEMFNSRQLLCLSILASRIANVADPALRDLFTCLFSGALEFNNMFTSYKGEGTGAVRHMFAHHILKPERVPLEANVWGTPRSSGSFSTMFRGRLMRALDYADDPFELRLMKRNGRAITKKVFGLSERTGFPQARDYADFATGKRLYLSCGDSGATDLDDASVDAVLTDPPFFDNVHYSQLSDFFHVWQRHILGANGHQRLCTTRSPHEVQSPHAESFTTRLGTVLREVHRVLKDEGLLVFTYHHSRVEGWQSMLRALMGAGFGITAAHPVKAEMSVAMPKQQARDPIDLDVIIVCRKASTLPLRIPDRNAWDSVLAAATKQIARFRAAGRRLRRNDLRVILMAQLIRRLSVCPNVDAALDLLVSCSSEIEARIDFVHRATCEAPS